MTSRARRPYEFLGGPKWLALQYFVNITNDTCASLWTGRWQSTYNAVQCAACSLYYMAMNLKLMY